MPGISRYNVVRTPEEAATLNHRRQGISVHNVVRFWFCRSFSFPYLSRFSHQQGDTVLNMCHSYPNSQALGCLPPALILVRLPISYDPFVNSVTILSMCMLPARERNSIYNRIRIEMKLIQDEDERFKIVQRKLANVKELFQ